MEPARVLIVEDEFVVANDIRKSVEGMGHSVSGVVSTGKAAIETTERERPDIVLMDIVLDGDMDGIRAAHEIGARFKTPFIFLTSFADEDVLRRAKAVGPSGFMVKPFDERELRANIEVSVHKAMMASKLRESEKTVYRTFDQAPIGAAVVSLDFRFSRVNAELCRITGYSEEELLARSFMDITYPDDMNASLENARRLAADEIDHYQIDKRYIRKDGEVVWVRSTVRMMKDLSGRPKHFLPMMEDITDRKRAEDEAHLAQTRLNEAIHSITVGFALFDADERFVLCNQTYRKYLGKAADILEPGLPFEQIFRTRGESGTFVDPVGDVEEFVQARLEQFRNPGSPFELPLSNGEWRQVLDYRTQDGGTFIIGTDITERKRAEEAADRERDRTAKYLEIAEALIVALDLAGTVTLINRRGCEVLGYAENEIVGRNWFDLVIPKNQKEEVLAAFAKIAAGEIETIEYFENEVLTNDGERRVITWHNTLVRDDDGAITGNLSSGQDITERKAAEEAALKAKEEAEFANRNKSEFLAIMGHELRTPLHGILGFSEAISLEMLGPITPPKYAEYVKDIHTSGEHLLSLINDLLDLSKIEAGKMELVEEAVPLPEIVTASQKLVRQRASNKELTLLTELAADLPSIYADRRAVQQVVHNLLTNSVKFTPQGGEISVGAKVEADGSVAVWCEDTGIGISAEDIPVVLAPFGQVRNLEHGAGGTGLGLPIVKSLMELHGGTLELTSEVGGGTIVTVKFPSERTVAD